MNYQAIVEYFDNLCRQHKSINHSADHPHFFRIDLHEFETAFKRYVASPAVYLELPEGRITGETLDNSIAWHDIALNLVTKVNPDDFTGRLKAYTDMEQIGFQLLSRVNRDYMNFQARLVPMWDWKSVRYYKISFAAHNMFGMRFEFQFGEPANDFRFYDNNLWLDA